MRWKRQVVRLARLTPNACLLDIGTGTDDLAREALAQSPQARVIAADLTFEMMRMGQKRGPLAFSSADALWLPFPDSSFDAAVSGFLMRNVVDLQQGLREQYRVLKKGGRIVILDTTRPKKNAASPFIRVYMHIIIPTLGRVVTRAGEAYRYLLETTEGFVTAEEMAARLAAAGLKRVGYQRLMFGTIAIHWGEK